MQDESEWSDYDQSYRKSLETTGDVLHREDSTHIITPDPEPDAGDRRGAAQRRQPATGRRHALIPPSQIQTYRSVAKAYRDLVCGPGAPLTAPTMTRVQHIRGERD